MNMSMIAVLLAVVALAIAIYAAAKWFLPIPQAAVTGLPQIKLDATAALASAQTNADSIDTINEQLGVVDTATTGFSTLAATAVTPHFPVAL